ncbi:MAG: lamin tail domain-containing protein, partial [Candidatus Methanomethylophilaceae archaeon]|nr:lamin tail domain-containing protein [Candidatus Methanomethylophilaceae archaeon]
MVRYRDAISIIVVTIMIFSAFPICISDSSDAAGITNDGILLFELDPKDATDGIALKNYSSKTIDIDGYVVKNSSGKEYKFEPLKVSSGNTIALVKKTVDGDWFCEKTDTRNVIVNSSSIALKNIGDAVYLYDRSGNLVDVVCYGNYTASDGWTGIPVDLGFKEHV